MKRILFPCIFFAGLFSSCNMGKFYANKRLNSGEPYSRAIAEEPREETIDLNKPYTVTTSPCDNDLNRMSTTEETFYTSSSNDNALFKPESPAVDTPEIIPTQPDTVRKPDNANRLDNILIERYKENKTPDYKGNKPSPETFIDKHPVLFGILTPIFIVGMLGLIIFLIALIFLHPLLAFWLTIRILLFTFGILLVLFLILFILLAIAFSKPHYRHRYY